MGTVTTVPNTEPMTQTEMTRAVNRIETMIAGVHTKLDRIPDWEDITRIENRRDAEQGRQDAAIIAVENKLTTLMFAIIGTALTAVAGVLRTL